MDMWDDGEHYDAGIVTKDTYLIQLTTVCLPFRLV